MTNSKHPLVDKRDHSKALGIIPGLRPPDGTVNPPEMFSRLPTQQELLAHARAWFGHRPTVYDYLQDFRDYEEIEEQQDAVRNYNRSWSEAEV